LRSAKKLEDDLISEAIDTSDSGNKKGSARIALDITPSMSAYVFFEVDVKRYKKLEKLEDLYPNRKIAVKNGDANEYVQKLCRDLKWHERTAFRRGIRAVLFLDPFGMSVDWKTLEAVAETKAIDIWYLFPTHAVLRQTPKDSSKIDIHKENSLNRMLGGDWWREAFYEAPPTISDSDDLFSISNVEAKPTSTQSEVRTATSGEVEQAFRNKLLEIFPHVCDEPLALQNHNVPMFSLFFAVSNNSPQAINLAKRASDYILKKAKVAGIHSKAGLYTYDQ